MKEGCVEEEGETAAPEDIKDHVESTGNILEDKIRELESSLKRVMADFDNYRKRMENERKRLMELAGQCIVNDLLPVIDDLERALNDEENLDRGGVEMIHRKLKNALGEHGLRVLECTGKKFDPYYHECMISQEVDDPEEDDMVLEEFRKGYVMNTVVIRPAKVKVGKYVSEEQEEVKEDEQ